MNYALFERVSFSLIIESEFLHADGVQYLVHIAVDTEPIAVESS